MRRKAEKDPVKQGQGVFRALLPLIAGMAETKTELLQWVHEVGMKALAELFENEAEALTGTKGKHQAERTHHRWGSTKTQLPLGGRRVQVERPRIRRKGGGEERLSVIESFRESDALPERVLQQILLGVSTRGYGSSLEPIEPTAQSRGTSKSSAARHLQSRMRATMKAQLEERLDEVKLAALMIDGIAIGDGTVVVALGVTTEGTKKPLGLWQGSTENATVCTALLQSLFDRGLAVAGPILCVIDGGKGLRKAIQDVFGERGVIQRCQIHKRRNVLGHLPKKAHGNVSRLLAEAYSGDNAALSRKRLKSLVSWLEGAGHDGAASSLREGLEETLTVVSLKLSDTLRRSLSSTNAIENTLGTVRRVTRNVKRWRGGDMARRWTAIGLNEAAKRFRRIKGYRDLPKLLQALADRSALIDRNSEAA